MTNVRQIALSKLSDKLQILIIRCQTQSCSLRKKFNIGLLFRQVALKMVTKLSNVRHKSSNGTDLTHSSWIPIYFYVRVPISILHSFDILVRWIKII